MSYLIKDNQVIATTSETLKSGETVRIAWNKSGDSLVNAVYAKVSNAKSWASTESKMIDIANADTAKLYRDSGLYKEFLA